MSDRPTPVTDAAIIERRCVHKRDGSVQLIELIEAEFSRKLERERDEAREKAERYRLEANAMMMQRDEARALVDRLHVAFEGRCRATYEWYSTQASDVREAALQFLYPEHFK